MRANGNDINDSGKRILIIYTGGTIGMIENQHTGALENFNWDRFHTLVPELNRFSFPIDAVTFEPPIDSSDMEPRDWVHLCHIIADNYDKYTGFVILHGTDTMAYTASALSFMLENLGKPVIITGSQLPIGKLRTDGKENLITSIEIAAQTEPDGSATVPEVGIFFKDHLLRGNRTTKISAEGFNAFRSFNEAPLAVAGINIEYNRSIIRRPDPNKPFKPHFLIDSNVVILTLFPGIRRDVVENICALPALRAVILKTYGSGNAPQTQWFFDLLKSMNDRGVVIMNISQCSYGTVEMGRYKTSLQLIEAGVLNGYDMTIECVVTKLMVLLGHQRTKEEITQRMKNSICGEVNINDIDT
ncbi:MAG: type I asparaginase [Bacteroidales bacterium]|nr:type I asparaginase [Bacteroidales bacterium]